MSPGLQRKPQNHPSSSDGFHSSVACFFRISLSRALMKLRTLWFLSRHAVLWKNHGSSSFSDERSFPEKDLECLDFKSCCLLALKTAFIVSGVDQFVSGSGIMTAIWRLSGILTYRVSRLRQSRREHSQLVRERRWFDP